MQTIFRRKETWILLFWWVLASTMAWTVGAVVAGTVLWTLLRLLPPEGAPTALAIGIQALSLAVQGTILGIPQWLILERRIQKAGWWVLASAVGWGAGWAVGGSLILITSDAMDPVLAGFLLWSLVGAMVGVGQWLILRRHVGKAGWWIPASAVGGCSIWGIRLLTAGWLGTSGAELLGGAALGTITGFALLLLLASPPPTHRIP